MRTSSWTTLTMKAPARADLAETADAARESSAAGAPGPHAADAHCASLTHTVAHEHGFRSG